LYLTQTNNAIQGKGDRIIATGVYRERGNDGDYKRNVLVEKIIQYSGLRKETSIRVDFHNLWNYCESNGIPISSKQLK
jgi:hypothetical protein